MVRETEISTQFGFVIFKMIPLRGVYHLKTNKGDKCLKKVNYGTQKVNYIYNAKESLIKNDFTHLDRNVLSTEGLPYALVNDDVYVLTEFIEGRECDFKVEEELKGATSFLADFHNHARGFNEAFEVRTRSDVGKLKDTLRKRLGTLNKMKDMARKTKRKSDFDYMYIENVDYYISLAKESLTAFNDESYGGVCQRAIEDRVLCHHDYTYHNILIDKEGQYNLIDFDYSKSEIQIYDLSTLIVKSLKRLDWESDKAVMILNAYNDVRKLSTDEISILKTMLMFPQRFWRLANRYFYKEQGWSEESFTKKMKEIINERENYKSFISNLDDIFSSIR